MNTFSIDKDQYLFDILLFDHIMPGHEGPYSDIRPGQHGQFRTGETRSDQVRAGLISLYHQGESSFEASTGQVKVLLS